MFMINEESSNYTWQVFGHSPEHCRELFAAMWADWCQHTGAEPDYWDMDDLYVQEIHAGLAMMDREPYRSPTYTPNR